MYTSTGDTLDIGEWYINFQSGPTFYSTDYGSSWTTALSAATVPNANVLAISGNGQYSLQASGQTVIVVYNTFVGYSTGSSFTNSTFSPALTFPVIAAAVSATGQYMVLVTQGTTNNVYYSSNYGVSFTGITLGSTAMVSCAVSADGSYITVANATQVFTLNSNTQGLTVALGNSAGTINQGQNAVAIGNQAGQTNQSANSIVLNSSGTAVNAYIPGFFVAPVSSASSSVSSSFAVLGYGTDNQVVQTGLTVLGNGNMGIGTVTPGYTLDVNGTTNAIGTSIVRSSAYVSGCGRLSYYNNTGSVVYWLLGSISSMASTYGGSININGDLVRVDTALKNVQFGYSVNYGNFTVNRSSASGTTGTYNGNIIVYRNTVTSYYDVYIVLGSYSSFIGDVTYSNASFVYLTPNIVTAPSASGTYLLVWDHSINTYMAIGNSGSVSVNNQLFVTNTVPLGTTAGNTVPVMQIGNGGSDAYGRLVMYGNRHTSGSFFTNTSFMLRYEVDATNFQFTSFNASGVGIGATNPSVPLQVVGSGGSGTPLRLINSIAGNEVGIGIYRNPDQTIPSTGDMWVMGLNSWGSGDRNLCVGTNNSGSVLTLAANGTVFFNRYNGAGTLTVNSSGQIITSSDRRIKEDIVYITDTQTALSHVNNLKPATFKFKDGEGMQLGFIAQDVEQFIPLAIDGKKYEYQWETDENGKPKPNENGELVYKLDENGEKIIRPRGLTDRAIIATQTLAIQELAKQNAALTQKLDFLLAWAQSQGFTA
jgi:hypothetical protein